MIKLEVRAQTLKITQHAQHRWKKTYIIKGTLGSISNSKCQCAPSVTMIVATKSVGVKETNLPKKRAKKILRVSTLVARNLLIL